MKINIIWSEPAKVDYWQNIDYLLEFWQEKQVKNFLEQLPKSE